MRARVKVLASALLTISVTACGNDDEPAPSPTPPTESVEPSVSAFPSTPPTGSPGITGAVNTGTASVRTDGSFTISVSYPTLSSPAIWTPPPGGIALNWSGSNKQTLGLSGASFTAQQPTSIERTLQFSVVGPDGLVTFVSGGGECLVTITPALPEQMGGTFLCTGIASEDGSVTVNAQGTFAAR